MSEAVGGRARDGARARRVPARPVLQPRQPGGPPAHDRAGDRRARSTAASTCSSPASAPAARSPASGEYLRERNPRAARSSRSSRAARRCCPAGRPGPHRIQGIGAGFVPRGAQPRAARRGDRGLRRRRDPHRLALRASGRACSPASPAAPRCGPRSQLAARPESPGKRIVVIMPDSGERYISQAVLRALSRVAVSAAERSLRCGHGWLSARSRGSRGGAPRRRRRARPRPGGARRRPGRDPRDLARHPRAARLPRRARAARGGRAGAAARDLDADARADRDRDPPRRAASARACSSTTAPAS